MEDTQLTAAARGAVHFFISVLSVENKNSGTKNCKQKHHERSVDDAVPWDDKWLSNQTHQGLDSWTSLVEGTILKTDEFT